MYRGVYDYDEDHEIRLDGNKYILWFSYIISNSKTSDQNAYDRQINPVEHVGSAEILQKETGKRATFVFITRQFGYFGCPKRDFDKSILILQEDLSEFSLDLAETIHPEAVVDLFAESILVEGCEKKMKWNRHIPVIRLPVLSATELREKGLMAQPDGQIALNIA